MTIALELWQRDGALREGAVGLLAVVLVVALSALWPRSRRTRSVLDWTIHGAATRSAARSVARIYARSVRVIAELAAPARPSRSLPPRLQDAIRRLVAS